MIKEDLEYTIYGKKASDRPVLAQCKPDATLQGTVHFNRSMDVYAAEVYAVQSPTGVSAYETVGSNLYTGSILGFTGYGSDAAFTFVPSSINTPTGAIDGELYGIKVIGSETGIFGGRAVADVIVEMNSDLVEV